MLFLRSELADRMEMFRRFAIERVKRNRISISKIIGFLDESL